MRLLVLGGLRFVGRVVVADAVRRGWEVTLFNRGLSANSPGSVRFIRGDWERLEDLARLPQTLPTAWAMSVEKARSAGFVCSRVRSEVVEDVAGY